jgi:hypothetical protein
MKRILVLINMHVVISHQPSAKRVVHKSIIDITIVIETERTEGLPSTTMSEAISELQSVSMEPGTDPDVQENEHDSDDSDSSAKMSSKGVDDDIDLDDFWNYSDETRSGFVSDDSEDNAVNELDADFDGSPNLCDRCDALDFDHILIDEYGKPRKPSNRNGLLDIYDESQIFTHFVNPRHSKCWLCRFFIDAIKYSGCGWSVASFLLPAIRSGFISLSTNMTDTVAVITPQGEKADQDWARGRQVFPDKIDYAFMKHLIMDCAVNHVGACAENPLFSTSKDFHVIDCIDLKVVNLHASEIIYLALSYVWGKAFKNESMGDCRNYELPERIPSVVKDAMEVVRKLGYRYLWVDRYCIPQAQDEASIHSRAQQVRSMDRIYSDAICTIIAAAGNGVEDGLPGVSSSNPRPKQPVATFKKCLLTGFRGTDVDISSSTWSQRGWTYQEGALSKRRIVFTENQVYFQCHQAQWFETLDTPVNFCKMFPPAFHIEPLDQQQDGAFRSITDYVHRTLTYRTDKQSAFQGMLNRWEARSSPVFNFRGLPLFPVTNGGVGSRYSLIDEVLEFKTNTDALVHALTWNTEKAHHQREKDFPSWTWLGWRIKRWTGCTGAYYAFPIFPKGYRSHYKAYIKRTYHVTAIDVLVGNGEYVAWNDHWDHICREVNTSTSTDTPIRITGYICEFPVEIRYPQTKLRFRKTYAVGDRWLQLTPSRRILRPLFAGQRQRNFVSVLLASHGPPEKEWYEDDSEPLRWRYCLMVLREVPGTDRYERLDVVALYAEEDLLVQSDGTASIRGFKFRRGTVIVQ